MVSVIRMRDLQFNKFPLARGNLSIEYRYVFLSKRLPYYLIIILESFDFSTRRINICLLICLFIDVLGYWEHYLS